MLLRTTARPRREFRGLIDFRGPAGLVRAWGGPLASVPNTEKLTRRLAQSCLQLRGFCFKLPALVLQLDMLLLEPRQFNLNSLGIGHFLELLL